MLVAARSLIKSAALKEEVLESYELKIDWLNRAVFETKCFISSTSKINISSTSKINIISSTSKIIAKVPEVELSRAVQRGDETVVFR